MNDKNDQDVGDERAKNIFWLVTALGLAVLLKGAALVLILTAGLK